MPRRTLATMLCLFAASALMSAGLSGCGPQQAYTGPTLPSYKTSSVYINPPQANIGFSLVAINGRPFSADVAVSILPVATKLTVKVWPTSSVMFEQSDPAFATQYQQIDNKYGRVMTISFEPEAGVRYGLMGNFNQGATPEESSYTISVFELGSSKAIATASSNDPSSQADQVIERAQQRSQEQWSVEQGPGS